MTGRLSSLKRYETHLEATANWLLRSLANGRGGSSALYTPLLGWSRSYPETTGYLIPTLLALRERLPSLETERSALKSGEWLLSIQGSDGSWLGGLHPPRRDARPSVFNTGQILDGMVVLHESTGEPRWLEAAARGASWLASGVGPDGAWREGNYRNGFNPSYYTQVAWPMLEVWRRTGDVAVRDAAVRVLDAILERRTPSGAFRDWGFDPGTPAFTHTIAYTLRGFLESARVIDAWDRYGRPVESALDRLARAAELAGGRLPGAYDEAWKPVTSYTCLTGNAQIALCLLVWEERAPDLRLVNAAAKLVDVACTTQSLHSPIPGLRGAVAGSDPPWGRYMFLRYPNWAAKYLCDGLLRLTRRLES